MRSVSAAPLVTRLLIRSLKIVNFRGIAELQARELREVGVHAIAVPAGCDPRAVAAALRFAMSGDAGPGTVISDGAGYAYVEVGLGLGGDAHASIFRGIDRRGAVQVSLREDGGMRITSTEPEVAARLEEILGQPVARWVLATFLTGSESAEGVLELAAAAAQDAEPDAAPDAQPDGAQDAVMPSVAHGAALAAAASAAVPPSAPALSPPEGAPVTDADVEAARSAALEATDGLRRALRTRELTAAIEADFAALSELGARVRRERTDIALRLERVTADRDKVRARLRRVNEYLDLVSQHRSQTVEAVAQAPAAPRKGRLLEYSVLAWAVVFAGILAWTSFRPGEFRTKSTATNLAGIGFVVACGSYLWIATRRGDPSGRRVATAEPGNGHGTAPVAAPTPPDAAWRTALRTRFADISDPDDPQLVPSLRTKLAQIDEEAAPLVAHLERIDEVAARHEVEIGRAARAIHRGVPGRDEAASGLAPDETPDTVEARIDALGDRVFQASVERDAFAARGTADPAAAEERVVHTFAALGAAAGDDAPGTTALDRAGYRAADAEGAPAGTDLAGLVASLTRTADDLAARARDRAAQFAAAQSARAVAAVAIPEAAIPAAQAPSSVRSAANAPSAPSAPNAANAAGRRRAAAAQLDAVARPWLVTVTLGRFHGIDVGDDEEIVLTGAGGDVVRWRDLDPRVRDRVHLALRARMSEREASRGGSVLPARAVILDARTAALGDDAALGRFLAEHAPSATQVLFGAAPAAPPAPLRPAPEAPKGTPPRPILPVPGTLPTPRPGSQLRRDRRDRRDER